MMPSENYRKTSYSHQIVKLVVQVFIQSSLKDSKLSGNSPNRIQQFKPALKDIKILEMVNQNIYQTIRVDYSH